ncbi:SGNH/GDSL hydrolase family protein [Amycolatopsis sp. NPDC059021]|uniref:SGNH/GDSL hydrolase family protein n=1 Tax=Amycolatopsis sp. NPDC059021 TaxID=3346704 RepID=UPI00366E86AC
MHYDRFVVLGDSCAEGLDDPYPGSDQYRGWADFVAARLAHDGFQYANLAVRGRRLDQITAEQIPTAQRLGPDLIALFGGGNDVLHRDWDERTVARRVDAAIRACARLAPTVVTFTLSDISDRVPFVRRMRPRVTALNDAIREASVSYGTLLVDLWPDQAAHDSRYFGPDRLHLSEAGHRRVAGHVLDRLGLEHDWLRPLPGTDVRPGLRGDLRWFREHVAPAMLTRVRNRLTGRSSGDGFLPKRPELQPVALSEVDALGAWAPEAI